MMMRRWRRGVVLAAVVAGAIAGGVLLTTQPWSDGETLVQEVAGGNIEYRLCNVSFWAPPQGDIIRVGRSVRWSEEGLQPELRVKLVKPEPAVVEVDPETGAVLLEYYPTTATKASIKVVLDTKGVEPLDLATAPWPYTDTAQVSAQRFGEKGTFEYRPPDPGSGIVVSKMYADGIGWFAQSLTVANCRSVMAIGVRFRADAEPEVTVTKDIHPEDEAAFQTFYDQVTINNDPLGR